MSQQLRVDTYIISPSALKLGTEKDQELFPFKGSEKLPEVEEILLLFFLNTPEWLSLLTFMGILIIWSWISKFANQKTKILESPQSSK